MSLIDDVIASATAKLGASYVVGTEGPTTFDCSGLMWWIFDQNGAGALIGGSRRRAAGYTRWAADSGQFTRDFRKAERGDLLVYEHPVGHVGIYLGGGDIISALVPPYGVKRTRYNRISVPFYGVIMVDYAGAGRDNPAPSTAPDTGGTEPDVLIATDAIAEEDIERATGRALWHIEFEDRPRRAAYNGTGGTDVVNKITRRRPPPVVITETDTTDGSPLSITTKRARHHVQAFATSHTDAFVYDSPGGGPLPGSYIQDWMTQADPAWPCSGLGIFYWFGRYDEEVWYEIDLTGVDISDWVGVRFTSTTGADDQDRSLTPDGAPLAGWAFYAGWGTPDPTAIGQWVPLGAVDPFSPWEIFVPRELLTAGKNALVFSPTWKAGGSFCGSELVSNATGPLIGGEGSSRRYQASSDSSIAAVAVTITGTGKTQWVPGDGAIDGSNATFTLLGWDGTGVPEARIDGLAMPAADYTYDATAKTVTFRVAPDADAQVAFRYNHT